MNCRDARVRLDRYLDGELEMDENIEVVRHLETCGGCTSVFEGERLLFDEIRRQASGPPAPAPLRDRITGQIAKARAAARPWPFARALVPAAAAAVLVAVFVTIFAAPLPAVAVARKAVEWHDAGHATVIPVSSGPEVESYYVSQGKKACIHENLVSTKMSYGFKAACVEASGPAGGATCWWVAACPKSGCRMSHACFPSPPGIEKVWPQGERRTFKFGDRTVVMGHRNGQMCLFVLDNASEADRFLAAR